MTHEELETADEVATQLRVKPATVIGWFRMGRIPRPPAVQQDP